MIVFLLYMHSATATTSLKRTRRCTELGISINQKLINRNTSHASSRSILNYVGRISKDHIKQFEVVDEQQSLTNSIGANTKNCSSYYWSTTDELFTSFIEKEYEEYGLTNNKIKHKDDAGKEKLADKTNNLKIGNSNTFDTKKTHKLSKRDPKLKNKNKKKFHKRGLFCNPSQNCMKTVEMCNHEFNKLSLDDLKKPKMVHRFINDQEPSQFVCKTMPNMDKIKTGCIGLHPIKVDDKYDTVANYKTSKGTQKEKVDFVKNNCELSIKKHKCAKHMPLNTQNNKQKTVPNITKDESCFDELERSKKKLRYKKKILKKLIRDFNDLKTARQIESLDSTDSIKTKKTQSKFSSIDNDIKRLFCEKMEESDDSLKKFFSYYKNALKHYKGIKRKERQKILGNPNIYATKVADGTQNTNKDRQENKREISLQKAEFHDQNLSQSKNVIAGSENKSGNNRIIQPQNYSQELIISNKRYKSTDLADACRIQSSKNVSISRKQMRLHDFKSDIKIEADAGKEIIELVKATPINEILVTPGPNHKQNIQTEILTNIELRKYRTLIRSVETKPDPQTSAILNLNSDKPVFDNISTYTSNIPETGTILSSILPINFHNNGSNTLMSNDNDIFSKFDSSQKPRPIGLNNYFEFDSSQKPRPIGLNKYFGIDSSQKPRPIDLNKYFEFDILQKPRFIGLNKNMYSYQSEQFIAKQHYTNTKKVSILNHKNNFMIKDRKILNLESNQGLNIQSISQELKPITYTKQEENKSNEKYDSISKVPVSNKSPTPRANFYNTNKKIISTENSLESNKLDYAEKLQLNTNELIFSREDCIKFYGEKHIATKAKNFIKKSN